MIDHEQRTKDVLKYIAKYANDNGYPPSVREICAALKISSTATCYKYINRLVEDGYIRKSPTCKRALEVVKGEYANNRRDTVQIPLVGKITAGHLKEAIEDYEDTYIFPNGMFQRGDLFMLTINGDSMIEAGIQNGDRVIIRRQPTAENGQIIAAMVDDKTTIKRFYRAQNHYILHPENKHYEDIIVSHLDILGILVGLIRTY